MMLSCFYFCSCLEVKKSQGYSSQTEHPWNYVCSFVHHVYGAGNKLAHLFLWLPTWLPIIPPNRCYSLRTLVSYEESLGRQRQKSLSPLCGDKYQELLTALPQVSTDLGAVWAGRKDYCLSSTRSWPETVCCLFHGVIWSVMGVQLLNAPHCSLAALERVDGVDGISQVCDLSIFPGLMWNAASCPELCAIVDEVRWAKVLAVNMLLGPHTSLVPIAILPQINPIY